MTPPVQPPTRSTTEATSSTSKEDEAEWMTPAEVLADRSLHASPGCACGLNGAGEFYIDPICWYQYEWNRPDDVR